MDKAVYVNFQIEIRDKEYSFDSASAREGLSLELPSLEFFSQLDTGNLFKALSLNLEAKFKQALEDKEKE